MDDYAPLNEAYQRDQDTMTDNLVINSVIIYDDVVGGGLE